jgi:hypothetical protein
MLEAILVAVVMVDIFWLGWLAHYPVDRGHPHSGGDCCISFPDVPDTPQELLDLADKQPRRTPSPSMWSGGNPSLN